MNKTKKVLLFCTATLLTTSIHTEQKVSFFKKAMGYAVYHGTKLLPPLHGVINSVVYKKYLLPKDIQDEVRSHVFGMVQNENFLTRMKTIAKVGLKNFNVYELPKDTFSKYSEDGAAFTFLDTGGIFFQEGAFKSGINGKNLGTIFHEAKHIIDNPMTAMGAQTRKIFPGKKAFYYKHEYVAQIAKVENLHKLGKIDGIEDIIKGTISNFVYNTHLTNEDFHRYFYGKLDPLLKLGYKKQLLQQAPKIIGEVIRENKKEILEIVMKKILKQNPDFNEKKINKIDILRNVAKNNHQAFKKLINSQQPAKNWRQRYREYKKQFPTIWNPRIPAIEG